MRQTSNGTRDLNVASKLLLLAGAVAVGVGIWFLATRPTELPMRADGWFESVEARTAATTRGTAFMMVGGFLVLTGAIFSRRWRRAALELQKQSAQALGEGFAAAAGSDPKARLERLEALHRDGTISDDEYRRKRAAIVDEL